MMPEEINWEEQNPIEEASIEFSTHVAIELENVRAKYPGQEFTLALLQWNAVLVEEVGEVSRDLNEFALGNIEDHSEFRARIYVELVQTAAMAERMACAVKLQSAPQLNDIMGTIDA